TEIVRRVSFRVGDQRVEAPVRQVVDRAEQAVAQGPGPWLEEDPTATSKRDCTELLRVQPFEGCLGHLAAGNDLQRNRVSPDRLVELLDARRELRDPNVVVVADVRGRRDRLDA